MLIRAAVFLSLLFAAPLQAEDTVPVGEQQTEATTEATEAESPGLTGEGDEAEALDYTQKERQQRFQGGIAGNIGPVMPWSKIGATMIWPQWGGMSQFSLGAGGFDFSDNFQDRNYLVAIQSQSAYMGWRSFPLGFGPIYIEPYLGLVRWSGSIKPRGFDAQQDQLASSLTSRFDSFGISAGGNFGLMWIFKNNFFLDYNLMSLSWAHLFREHYSNNTSAARNSIRAQIKGPLTLSAAHLRFGYTLEL